MKDVTAYSDGILILDVGRAPALERICGIASATVLRTPRFILLWPLGCSSSRGSVRCTVQMLAVGPSTF